MQFSSKYQHNSLNTWNRQFSKIPGKKKQEERTILNNKTIARGITINDLKLYYRAIVLKIRKQHGFGTEIDTLANAIELKTQK